MTVEQYIAKLNRQIEAIERNDKALLLAASSVHGKMVTRIFEDGLDSNGNKIGNYSTKEMLATETQFDKKSKFKQTIGKTKTGKPKPLWLLFPRAKKKGKKAVPVMRISGGYKTFREMQGKESGFVNLRYRGTLRSDFTGSLSKRGRTYVSGTKNKANTPKIDGAEKRFNAVIFRLTKEERNLYNEILRKELINQLK